MYNLLCRWNNGVAEAEDLLQQALRLIDPPPLPTEKDSRMQSQPSGGVCVCVCVQGLWCVLVLVRRSVLINLCERAGFAFFVG